MTGRLIDLDDDAHVFCGHDGEYEKWNIDTSKTVDAVPVEFIEAEIKRMELEIDIAMSEADDETAERWITRKTTLEFVLEKWRSERGEE